MSAKAKKITYTIKAEYDGQSELKKLATDLKSLDRIEVMKGSEQSFMQANKDFVEMKNKVRELRKEMKKPGGEAFAASYSKARQELVKLQTAMQKQKDKIDDTRASLRKQGTSISEVSEKYKDMQAAAERSARTIAARQKIGVRSWREIESEIKGLKRAYKDLEASGEHSMSELAQAKQKLETRVKRLNTEMGKTPAVARQSNAALAKTTAGLNSFLGAYLGVAGAMAAGYGLSRIVEDVTRGAKEMGNWSKLAGQSVGEFAATAYAVRTVGIEAEKLADMSKDVKDKIGDFIETGGGEFADFFEILGDQVGVTAEELIKMSGPDALIAIKDALEQANVPLENQVFYFEALANDASLLIPLLANNGQKMKELAARAKEMGIAISDLDHKKLLELGEVLREFSTNIGIIKRDITLALAPAIKDMAGYFRENKEEIKDFVVGFAKAAGGIGKFVVENSEMLAILLKVSVALIAVNQGVGLLATTGGRLNKIGTGLASVATGLKGIQLSALSASTALGAAAAATLALIGGYKAGEWLSMQQTMREISNATGVDGVAQATASRGDVVAQYEKIGKSIGRVIATREDLTKAEADGLVKFDEATGEWVAGSKEMAAATTESTSTIKRVTGDALEEMKKKYQEYADEIRRLQDEISGREQSLAEQLRDMGRTGMSDLGAWKDRKREAEEYEKAARQAMAAGNYEEAVNMADRAKTAYADLNKEVKAGEKVAISQKQALTIAMAGVEDTGKLAIQALQAQQDAAAKSMETLTDQSGLQDLAKGMDESKQQWINNWLDMRQSTIKNLDEVEQRIIAITKDRNMTVYVNEVVSRATGGAIGALRRSHGGPIYGPARLEVAAMAFGGRYRSAANGFHFPGYGGGDQPKNLVMAEDGEVMLRKESVRAAGLRAALAFNAGRFDIVMRELLQRFDAGVLKRRLGGTISAPINNLPSFSQMMSAGGSVLGGAGGQSLGHYTHDINFPGAPAPVRVMTDRQNTAAFINGLKRMQELAS